MPELPVSVVVPLSAHRMPLLEAAVLPAIRQNQPAEVHIVPGNGNANVKRNEGAKRSTQPYLFFCDDDVVLASDALTRLLLALQNAPKAVAYTYGDFMLVSHPKRKTDVHKAGVWDANRLRQANYISTMSLIRADVFREVGGFDESIERLQDYDLWLTMLARGYTGLHIGGYPLFVALHLGDNITKPDITSFNAAMRVVHEKHGLGRAA